MADQTHEIVTKVTIAAGCIVCDACENDCPEVFDVQEQICVIRPGMLADASKLAALTPSLLTAAAGCPVEVIHLEKRQVAGPAPWPASVSFSGGPEGRAAAASIAAPQTAAKSPATPQIPADPRWQALLNTTKLSAARGHVSPAAIAQDAQINQANDVLAAAELSQSAPLDQRMALLTVGGGYGPKASLAQRICAGAASQAKSTRRRFNAALAVGWGALSAAAVMSVAMFQDFFGPKVLREPRRVWRVGKLEDFGTAGGVYESFKRTPDGGAGFWVVNLQPKEERLVAVAVTCTHLGCIPEWLPGDQKFKCPCHGSGFYQNGVNFEGPTPRPLERFAIRKDPDGRIIVDQSKVYRQELGEWDDPESYIALG